MESDFIPAARNTDPHRQPRGGSIHPAHPGIHTHLPNDGSSQAYFDLRTLVFILPFSFYLPFGVPCTFPFTFTFTFARAHSPFHPLWEHTLEQYEQL